MVPLDTEAMTPPRPESHNHDRIQSPSRTIRLIRRLDRLGRVLPIMVRVPSPAHEGSAPVRSSQPSPERPADQLGEDDLNGDPGVPPESVPPFVGLLFVGFGREPVVMRPV